MCSKECRSKRNSERETSPEVRKKISDSRKLWLKENPEKHPWKLNKKFVSEPCEKLKNALEKEGIKFISEFQPLLNEGRFYSIDIAFPQLKLGIEINGEQHYNRDKTLKKYYQERHNTIVNAGWTLLEYHYSFCYKDDKINELIESLKNNTGFCNVDFELKEFIKVKKQKSVRDVEEEKEKFLKKYEEVFNTIDLKSFGWIQKASVLLGKSHTQIRRIQENYFPHLNVYKRAKASYNVEN
jgi:very-short-patch-repair endonuclease